MTKNPAMDQQYSTHQVSSPLPRPHLVCKDVTLVKGSATLLNTIDIPFRYRAISTVIGPSGAGKSSLLRCMNLLEDDWRGQISIDDRDIREWPGGDDKLRRFIGMIQQKPTVFPCSIEANVGFALQGRQRRKRARQEIIERSLRQAALWEEVAYRLDEPAESLSVGQQQRLCIARALAISPGILLLDEPTASLDRQATRLIEETLTRLSRELTIVVVTHDLEQARRIGNHICFICAGRVIEQGPCGDFFDAPRHIESREFIHWRSCDCPDQ